ncbi:DUF2842 domain-containing protein [Wenxinia saemankumensis]|uniref:DUF2842 domain-containing protein n=1 Tax=Wenxinia saemankumensis TaxID=1447782 RepID=A0A1M6CHD2_9RHOB|nr:DUF2842 domain-containing protein [Wenxinia saemankumensis]SHI60164.1 Protein of unknown function [Wenxinia saemankumensis]
MARSPSRLSHKARKRLSILFLVVGLPAYIVACVTVVNLFDRPPILLELAVYVALGIVWAFLARPIFLGVGRAAPEDEDRE